MTAQRKMRKIVRISQPTEDLAAANAHLTKLSRNNRIAERILLFGPLVTIAIGFAIYGFADWPAAIMLIGTCLPLYLMMRWLHRTEEEAYLSKIIRGRLHGYMR